MPQSYYSFYAHVIFSTKNRENLLNTENRNSLSKYIYGIVKNEEARLLESGGTENHIHLLLSLTPKTSPVDLIRIIKTNSSKWLRSDLLLKDFKWQNGYGFFSVSYSEVEKVKKYIQKQALHHKKISFKEEFILFLEKNQILYNRKYLWE